MKKKIYFVQVSNMLSNSIFLPYATGAIAAYSWQHKAICDLCEPPKFIFIKESIDEVLKQISQPFVVAFSCYLWNIEYNLNLASEIKQLYPEVYIVFGGPQIPDDISMLENYTFIDALIHGEGERAFYETLMTLLQNGDLSKVYNISFRTDFSLYKTQSKSYDSLEGFPSPYTNGYFDNILNDSRFRGMQFDAVLETNRGCPFKCTYCAWSIKQNHVRFFSLEKIKAEIDWFSNNKIFYCFCADSNFGLYERDEDIVDYVVNNKKLYGFPVKLETTTSKEKKELAFRINSKLNKAEMNRGISVACQSVSEVVLKNINREPISMKDYEYIIKQYRDANISTYTDLILGLPGESADSFLNGVFEIIEAGQHNSLNVNNCELLPNSILSLPEVIDKFGIKTVKSTTYQNHSVVCCDRIYGSVSNVIVETKTMTKDDWVYVKSVLLVIQCFHYMGLLRYYAFYLRKSFNVSYKEFYMSLFRWINGKSTVIKGIFEPLFYQYVDFLTGNSTLLYKSESFGEIYWPLDEAAALCVIENFESFYLEIEDFLSQWFVDKKIYSDLKKYCKSKITKVDCESFSVDLFYDWESYFSTFFNIQENKLEKKNVKMTVHNRNGIKSIRDYAKKVVWYGKRDCKIINKDISYTIV